MIRMERLNEVAQGLEAALCAEVGGTVVTKEDSTLHRVIATSFDGVITGMDKIRELSGYLSFSVPDTGLPDGNQYLSDFATTIGTEIAMPREWRKPESAASRLIILPHEAVHVRQHRMGVDAGWWPNKVSHSVLYLCSVATDDAAEYLGKVEADAYATSECVSVWLGRQIRPIDHIVSSLRKHYALSMVGQQTAEGVLLSHYSTIADGGVPNLSVCRFTMNWLNTNAPDLRGQLG